MDRSHCTPLSEGGANGEREALGRTPKHTIVEEQMRSGEDRVVGDQGTGAGTAGIRRRDAANSCVILLLPWLEHPSFRGGRRGQTDKNKEDPKHGPNVHHPPQRTKRAS